MSQCDISGHNFETLRSFTGRPICSVCGEFDKDWTPPDEDEHDQRAEDEANYQRIIGESLDR